MSASSSPRVHDPQEVTDPQRFAIAGSRCVSGDSPGRNVRAHWLTEKLVDDERHVNEIRA